MFCWSLGIDAVELELSSRCHSGSKCSPRFDIQTYLMWIFSLACFCLSLKNLCVAVSISAHSVVRFADNETKKLLSHQQSLCCFCPPQGEGSTEWVGTADPGWLRGGLSFSRYKGKIVTCPLPPIEQCCWKLFNVIVVGFNLIWQLDLISLCFRSYFRKQTSLPSCRVLGILSLFLSSVGGRETTPFLCRAAPVRCSEVCKPVEECPRQLMCGPKDQRGVPSASHPGYWLFAGRRRCLLCFGKGKHRLSVEMPPPSLSPVYPDSADTGLG